jgi:hypothetical protein
MSPPKEKAKKVSKKVHALPCLLKVGKKSPSLIVTEIDPRVKYQISALRHL